MKYRISGRSGNSGNWIIIKEKRWWGWKRIAEFGGDNPFNRADKYLDSMIGINDKATGVIPVEEPNETE